MSGTIARSTEAASAWRRGALTMVERFPSRLHDRRFWVTQALVIGISAAHTALEASGHLGVLPDLALLPVSTYFIPVVYAALNFGVEGAVPTALWCALLSLPNVILWHAPAERPGVLLQLALLVVLAYVIARRVDVETEAKEHAQAANARLARVNRTAAASARSLDLDTVIAETVQAILDPTKNQTSWAILVPGAADSESVICSATGSAPAEPAADALSLSRSLLAHARSGDGDSAEEVIRESREAIVPLRVSGTTCGVVGIASADEPLSDDEARLLEAVGNQLSVALGNIRHFRQTQTMVGELSRAQAALQEYVRLATDAQEEERKRLARELHDDTIQTLVVAKAELDSLASEPANPGTTTRLRQVESTLTSAIDSVRRFSRDLRPSLLDDLGLVDAIDWLVGDLAARTGIQAQLRTTGSPRRLSPSDEVALFRIVQEALHNIERHSEASEARVRLHFNDAVRTTVLDNGKGFDPTQATATDDRSTRLGMLGMRERAKLAGAELSISSRPRNGTRIAIKLQPRH
ncbi:MAG: GAF domain-containing sensor histidine kinase [Gaiellaceae bacterium]